MASRAHSPEGDFAPDSTSEVNVEADLLTAVSSALSDSADKDVFAIGGKIDIINPSSVSTVAKGPVVIRWDSDERCHDRKVVLPVNDDVTSQRAFAQLLEDCEPATFGLADKEVLDETYRKAGKMDEAKFSTNFSPYEHGVIDTAVQALVHSNHTDAGYHGIRAELYKLNVGPLSSLRFREDADDASRSTLDPQESSDPMWTHLDRKTRWGHW
jgi:hypothetical protein